MNQTFTYRARPSGLAARVYCDTSFVIDLFAYAHPTVLGSAGVRARSRVNDAQAFYVWAKGQGLEFYVSLLAIEEAYQLLLFTPVRAATSAGRFKGWKDFRAADSAAFTASLKAGRQAVGTFNTFLRGSGLQLLTFGAGPFSGLLVREARVTRYARALIASYESDVMDAFHFALMRRAGIEVAAASDHDWTKFPFGTLITRA